MVAPDYTTRRSELAKTLGLGRRRDASETQSVDQEIFEVAGSAQGRPVNSRQLILAFMQNPLHLDQRHAVHLGDLRDGHAVFNLGSNAGRFFIGNSL